MRFHYKDFKSWAWPICAMLFNMSRLSLCRNKHLWVFGNCAGKLYDDNTKYLFEYVNTYYKGQINTVWFTNSEKTVKSLNAKGFCAVKNNTWTAYWILLRCGVAFYTHSLGDFGRLPLMGGAYVVTPWHGMGFKNIYGSGWKGSGKIIRKIRDAVFNWVYCNCACLTSEYTREQFKVTLGIPKERIYITGQPRNDVLLNQNNRPAILKSMGLPTDKKIILYLPTYRNYFQQGPTLDDIINDMMASKDLNSVIESENYLVVIKLHPWTANLKLTHDNVNYRVLNADEVHSVQELLVCGDILVTDYSSCFIDFSLLLRPILFYIPDEEHYLKSSGGMADDYYRISKSCASKNPKDLSELINKRPTNVAFETNSIFDDKRSHTGSFTRNVIDTVMHNLSITNISKY